MGRQLGRGRVDVGTATYNSKGTPTGFTSEHSFDDLGEDQGAGATILNDEIYTGFQERVKIYDAANNTLKSLVSIDYKIKATGL